MADQQLIDGNNFRGMGRVRVFLEAILRISVVGEEVQLPTPRR